VPSAQAASSQYPPGQHPDLPAPPATVGVVGWLRANLFSSGPNTGLTLVPFVIAYLAADWFGGLSIMGSVLIAILVVLAVRIVARIVAGNPVIENTLLTIIGAVIIVLILNALFDFTVLDAVWDATGRKDCAKSPDGACWGFVSSRSAQFVFGFYPHAERWRVILTGVMLVALIAPLLFGRGRARTWAVGLFLFVFPVVAFFLLYGGLGLTVVPTNKWGGMMLTLVIAVTGITASLPLGVLLALGRRSDMPAIRNLCVVFIELWRGVPLITVLFMASVMFPLFLPEGVTFNQLLRALIGVALFSAAYMAEVIRGGLQAIPKGQYEAAAAMGLSYWKSMRLIILPQALTIVIPGIVNSFISLFKDTSLVLIIGLFDFLGTIQAGMQDPTWSAPNIPMTGYVFAAFVYWCFCFGMSRYSVWLEGKLSTGRRH
jgi:general L-amino acid transport system permease protein